LDVRDEAGRDAFFDLLERADVFVTNMRGQKLEAIGLDYDALRERFPQLIYADISAYGNDGEEKERAGYDMVLQARAGLMSVNGEPERPAARVGVSILDMGSGIWLALGVLAALRARDTTGIGSRVSTSLLEVGASFMAYDCAAYQMTGVLSERRGSEHPAFAPYAVFACRDGSVAIGVGADHLFARLADAVGAPEWIEDERFTTNALRVAHRHELRAALEERLAAKTAGEWAAVLDASGIPADVVADVAGVLADEQLAAVDMWVETPIPEGLDAAGRRAYQVPGLPIRFDQERPPVRLAPPLLGLMASAAPDHG
jgi:crotonobetainyl-CoA:carnitine CoA-transferase CaiB-like acyl-CoA transferase